jgi:hypothetical protein
MHQIHPRQDGSARARSVITKRDLTRKPRPRASGHRPKAGAVLTAAAARRALSAMGQEEGGKMTSTSTGLAPAQDRDLAAARRGDLITPEDFGYNGAPGSLSRPC